MATFVLVPGAWLGAWAWADVVPFLESAGHRADPVTLPGLAERDDEAPPAGNDLSVHVDDLVGRIAGLDGPVILVVHSYAGALGGMVADALPDRLARVVYLATQPVPDGMSLFDLIGPDAEQAMRAMAAAAGDPDRLPVVPDDMLDLYYPGHGLTGTLLDRFREHATPHPIATQAQPVSRTGAGESIPRTLLWCTGDGPTPTPADSPSWTIRELPTGHWPMLTHPTLVAQELLTT